MEGFTGTWRLVRLALRRDRYVLPIWLVAIFVLTTSITASMVELYPDDDERAGTAANRVTLPMIIVLRGPLAGESIGQIAVHESYMFQAVLIMAMAISCVVRHTRQNEETGRSEMLLSGILGRYALLTAALITALVACAGIIIVSTLGMVINGLGFSGSLAGALGLAGVGLAFAGIAALAAQIPQSARGATSLAIAAGGAAFMLRSIGDANATVSEDGLSSRSSWVSWLSPLAWGQQVRAFEGERWWVLLLPLALFVTLCLIAFRLLERRDDGRGMFSAPPGPESASPQLLSSFGLAWRLHRGSIMAWSIAILAVGTMLGFVGAQGDDLASQSEQAAEALTLFAGGDTTADPRAVFFAMVITLVSVAIGAYTIQAIARMRSEELGTLESVLAGSVKRANWLIGHLTIAAGGAVFLLLLLGLTLGLVGGLASGDMGEIFANIFATAAQQIPAVLTLAGFAVLVFALRPTWFTGATWAGLALITALLGLSVANALTEGDWELPLGTPERVLGISPFVHTTVPATDEVTASALLLLISVTMLMTLASLVLFRRRDLAFGGV